MSTQIAPAEAPLSDVVAANIRAEMARRGWTQTMLAERMGLDRMRVSERCRGRARWQLDEVERAAATFGLPLSDLLVRPKGFEPLTFWFGVHGWIHAVQTVAPSPGHLGVVRAFCGECGLTEAWSYGAGTVIGSYVSHWAGRHADDAHMSAIVETGAAA